VFIISPYLIASLCSEWTVLSNVLSSSSIMSMSSTNHRLFILIPCRSTCTPITFLLVDQTSQNFLLNLVEIVADQVCFGFLISKIFTVKVKSCLKSDRIFDFLAVPNFWGAGPQKFVHKWSCPPHGPSCGKVSWGHSFYPQTYSYGRICQILGQFWTPLWKKL